MAQGSRKRIPAALFAPFLVTFSGGLPLSAAMRDASGHARP
jgi:hypothetical protein